MLARYLFIILIVFAYPFSVPAKDIQTTVLELSPIQIEYPNASGMRLGASISAIGDFDGDKQALDFAIGAPGLKTSPNDNSQINGAVFIVYGDLIEKSESVLDLNKPDANRPFIDLSHPDIPVSIITGTNSHPIGHSISEANDLNKDGFSDLAIGTSNQSSGFILFGTQTWNTKLNVNDIGSSGIEIQNTGLSVSPAGDFNGDGYHDVLFGSPISEKIAPNENELNYGAFTVLFGKHQFPNKLNALIPSKYLHQNRGLPNSSYAEHISGGIDFNNDDISDIIITEKNTQPDSLGSAYVVFGSNYPFQKGHAEYKLIIQSVAGEVTFCEDVDKDSYPELLISLPENQTLVLYGKENLYGTIDVKENAQEWGTIIKGAEKVYSVGDLNGDGFNDIAAAIPKASVGSQVMTGQVLLLFGSPQKHFIEIDVEKVRQGQFIPIDYILLNGVNSLDTFGASIAGIGDIQKDGFGDLLIGAPSMPLPGDSIQSNPGTVYLINGRDIFFALQTHRSTFSLGGNKQ